MKHELILHKIDGSRLNLYNRNATSLSTVTSGEQRQTLNSDDIVMITVESAVKITFDIGDKMNILGRWYKINRLPTVKKTGNRLFTYNIELEGVQYDLARVVYDLTIDTTSNALQDVQADMLTGNLERFARVLISNANRVFPGKWVLGDFPAGTEDKTLVFGETDNCLLVLQRLCSEYNTEFEIIQAGDVNTLHFRKAGQIYPYTFEYGKGKGLYSLERLNVSTSNIVTRLKVYGGTRNITAKYRAARLCLPGKTKGQSYIQKTGPANNYGIWEATKIFEHIYPKRTGTVTAIDSGNVLKLTDSTMNFDLNEKEADGITTKYLIDGSPAKIHFNTGNLSGYEFEIQSYDHATKTFTLKPFEDERGERFPSEKSSAFKFAVNDKYVLLDIALPQSYIDDAEEQLAEEGDIYYDQNSQPKVQYSLEVAEDFLKELSGAGSISNIFSVGDYIPVKDADIDVDKSVRVQSFTRDLLNPFSYKLNISDTVTTTITNRVISELIEIDKITKINDIKSQVKARRDWRSAQELLDMVFDTEGDYYSEKIKPNSIETSMLAVGAKSTQFGLVGTVIQANYNGNKNSVNVKGGTLSHYAIEESGRNWTLADGTTTLTGDSTPYYIYAKCQKVGTAGSIIFSTQKITVEQDPSFYHFLIGVVNSVDPTLNVRSVALTYGFTTVNGKFIRTGRIQSNDGLTYFDLDLGEIGGKITFRSTGGTDEDLAEILDGVAGDIQDTQAAVNNLQIGGRNLIVLNPQKWERGSISSSGTGSGDQGSTTRIRQKEYYPCLPDTDYVISKHTPVGKALVVFYDNNKDRIINKGWYTVGGVITSPSNASYFRVVFAYEDDSTILVSALSEFKFKLEKGNKATDWTEAPEDVQAEIDSAKQEALSAASDAQSTADSLKNFTDTAFRDGIIDRSESVAIEKYKNSLNEAMAKAEASYNKVYANTYLEGTAKTSLLNAKINLWGQRDTLLSAINTAIAGGTTTPAQKTAVDNAFNTFNSLMSAFQNALEEANKSIQAKLDALSTEKVDNLQIGGKNLLVGSKDYSLSNPLFAGSTATDSGMDENFWVLTLGSTYLQINIPSKVAIGEKFTFSFIHTRRSLSAQDFQVTYGSNIKQFNSNSDVQKLVFTAVKTSDSYLRISRVLGGSGWTLRVDELQLEMGDKATGYSEATEDIQARIDAEKTRINDILSDNVADPSEKQYLSNLWQEIYAEYPRIWAQADTYAVDKSNYEAKYTALNNLLSPVLANLTTNSTVSGASIRTAFSQYYDARTFLLNNITNKVNQNADAAGAIAADAQAKANTAKAVTDKFRTTIDGGLISTVMVLLRELNSQQDTAGISGIQGALKNQPAFWSGGKYEQAIGLIEFLHHMSEGTPPGTGEGQFDYQAKYQQLAPVAILHNGAAKVGDFLVLESGRIAMIDPSTGIPRLVFSVTDLPLIENLISEIEDTGTVSNDSQNNVRGSYIFPNGINIEKNDSRLRFVLNWNSYLYVDGGDWGADGMVSFVLLRNGVYYDLISEFYALADPYETASEQLYTVKDFESLPAGYYTVQAIVQDLTGMDAVRADIGSSQLTYYFKLQGVRRQQYGLDGMMFYYSDHHFHFTEGGGLDGRALPDKWNAPGVLLSATILANGGWNRVWGAKQSPTPPPAPSPTGRYTIYHTIGHTNYQVNCISYTENRSFRVYAKNTNSVVVECRTIGSSPTLSNAMFDITLTGNNY